MKGLLVAISIAATASSTCVAMSADKYAVTSRLASGKWVKFNVEETGMQLITDATLRKLGFSDPEKVNVFGYGGQMISESLDDSQIDDLPLIPSVRTPRGIAFFGHSSVSVTPANAAGGMFSHEVNPYSDNSFYFLSDREPESTRLSSIDAPIADCRDTITSFTERIVYEKDLIAPSNTGRLMLGEDFRTVSTRAFRFDLPGIISDVTISVRFGAKVTNGSSTLLFYANGNRLPATESDKIAGVSSNATFLATTTTDKTFGVSDDRLDLSIQYSHSGALFTAALDYIRISYQRDLKLKDGELLFPITAAQPSRVRVAGCDENTIILNVTAPLNPSIVAHDLTGQYAEFTTSAGQCEYLAFDPTRLSRSITYATRIPNQNLHSEPAPDMLIISPADYSRAAEMIARVHEETDGMSVLTVSPEMVYNEFSSGTPDVSAFRKLLKMWFDRSQQSGEPATRYCLILSKPTYDNKMVTPAVKNAGHPRVPIWQSPTGMSEATSYSTDDFIGMLEDYYPGWDIGNAKINVAVGRMPVKNAEEALAAATKLKKYIVSPEYGAWRNNVMVIADDQDNGVHLSQAENVCAALTGSGDEGASFIYEKLYLDSYTLGYSATGPVYPEAKQRMLDKFSEGVLLCNYIGHASTKGWGHENLLTWEDISSLDNTRMPFLYASTCDFLRWDADEVSGAEQMWLNPSAGVIGMICPSRTVYISLNGPLNNSISDLMFRRDSHGKAPGIGDIMREGKNAQGKDTNKLRYALMGDPAMRILPDDGYRVVTDSINGNALSASEDFPVLKARSSVRISGRVTDLGGNTVSDFNGPLSLRLYDAEIAVTTHGNGENGRVMTYNDRKRRLASGKAMVSDGVWEATLILPAEIEDNYSPALLSGYASDKTGREASGSTDRLYVYGYDTDTPEDSEGPEISSFYLDSPEFTDGASTGPSPTVKATVSDMSGINSSDSGIGHGMRLTLDDRTHFNDLYLHFSPDNENPCAGEISYRLSGIEPGDHKLTLTVWDNAGNSSSSTLSFKTSADWRPTISDLRTDNNPATADVNFLVSVDSSDGVENCLIEVFSLSGRKIWSGQAASVMSGGELSVGWDLTGADGARVARGIYPYRATLTTRSGRKVTKSSKLAVTAK